MAHSLPVSHESVGDEHGWTRETFAAMYGHLTALTVLAVVTAGAEPATWHDADSLHRLALTVKADPAPAGGCVPIVVTGEQFYRLTGSRRVSPKSIWLNVPP